LNQTKGGQQWPPFLFIRPHLKNLYENPVIVGWLIAEAAAHTVAGGRKNILWRCEFFACLPRL